MAKVWLARKGAETTKGGPWRNLPIRECVDKLGLRQSDFRADLSAGPRFGDAGRPTGWLDPPVAVVVQIEESEEAEQGWQPGYYVLDISPTEAKQRL